MLVKFFNSTIASCVCCLSMSIEFQVFSLSAFFRASIVCLLFVVFGVFSTLSEQSMLHRFVVLSISIVFFTVLKVFCLSAVFRMPIVCLLCLLCLVCSLCSVSSPCSMCLLCLVSIVFTVLQGVQFFCCVPRV